MPAKRPPEETHIMSMSTEGHANKQSVDRSAPVSYGLAIALALLFVALLFPLSFIEGKSAFFEQIDASSNVAGWLFYVQDGWHFPLLQTTRLNHPEGVSVVFTDSIPIAAILFKSVSAWLPEGFHYFGWWHALVFVVQAIAAVFLMRALGVRHLTGTIAATVSALTWPALLWRLGHTSLMTHGILLFGLAFYFLARSGRWSGGRSATALAALSIIGLMVHPYFLAFIYPLFLALLADQALAGEGWKKQVPRLLASLAALAVTGIVLGYFGHGSTTTFGFGEYSMNLVSPFCGGRLIGCAVETTHHQFGAFRFADATGGQYEGYNYFGAGLLLLLPFAIVMRWADVKSLPRRYPALIVLLILFTIYALSTTVYFGMSKVASYSLPSFLDTLTGTFRASGRFFWMIGYAVLFATLAGLLRQTTWRGLLLLAVALPLQWLDTQPLREMIHAKAARPATDDLAQWQSALANIDKINIFPAFGCGGSNNGDDVNIYWYFQRLAAHYGKLLDTGYVARPNVDCKANARAFGGEFQPRQLYVMSAAYLKNPFVVPAAFPAAARRGACIRWKDAVACYGDAHDAGWKSGSLQASQVAIPANATWAPSELPTRIGHVVNGRLVPVDRQQAGHLSFGPYIILPQGRYHYAIDYASDSDPKQQVGRWDISLGGSKAGTPAIAAGPIAGTAGQARRIEGEFDVGNWNAPLEIRTFFTGGGDLQLIAIVLDTKQDKPL
jgi:hypothetical protein